MDGRVRAMFVEQEEKRKFARYFRNIVTPQYIRYIGCVTHTLTGMGVG